MLFFDAAILKRNISRIQNFVSPVSVISRIALLIPFLLHGFFSSAQCKDPNWVTPIYICSEIFQPVCGCDGVTYMNQCQAVNVGGILFNNYTDGVCPGQDFEFFIYPNPVGSVLKLRMQFNTFGGNATLMISSVWGEVVYRSNIQKFDNQPIYLDIQEAATLRPGMYFFIVYTANQLKVKKFVAGVF